MSIHEYINKWESSLGKNLFQNIGIAVSAIVIDFGCGHGEYSIAASKYLINGKIYAIDKNKAALSVLKNKMRNMEIENIEVIHNNGELRLPFSDEFADAVLFYDMIHGNEVRTINENRAKIPIRFELYTEAYRVLKVNGIMSIAPFRECDRMRDQQGKQRKYSKKQLVNEVENNGFIFSSEIEGAIHFEAYHSSYQWEKHNNDMQFDDLEKGTILNFVKHTV